MAGRTDTHTNGRKRGGKGARSPQQGGGRGRGPQAPAHARPRVPAGNGESLRRTPHAPQGQRPPRGEPQRGGAHERAPTGQSDAEGRGRSEATGETLGPEPPPEQSEWGAERGRTPRVAQGRASERSERAERGERVAQGRASERSERAERGGRVAQGRASERSERAERAGRVAQGRAGKPTWAH